MIDMKGNKKAKNVTNYSTLKKHDIKRRRRIEGEDTVVTVT